MIPVCLFLTKIAMIPFADGVRRADRIVVGRVARVVSIGGHRFADVEIERTLKGPTQGNVRFLAEKTWACDSSTARVGERAVFLLDRLSERSEGLSGNAALRQAVERAGEAYSLNHAGSGRLAFIQGGVPVRRSGSEFILNNYQLPKTLLPGRLDADRGWFVEGKFVAAVEKLARS